MDHEVGGGRGRRVAELFVGFSRLRGMRRIRLIALGLGLLALGLVTPAAGAEVRSGAPQVLHLSFHVVKGGGGGVVSSGRYTLARRMLVREEDSHLSPTGWKAVLIDERTGARKVLSPPGCPRSWSGAWFGGPWLLFDCGKSGTGKPSAVLYQLASGRWVSVPSPVGQSACADSTSSLGGCVIVGVGRYWIQLLAVKSPESPFSYLLQNIQTGSVVTSSVKPGGRTGFDLNASSGTRQLCFPLRYPKTWNAQAHAWEVGWLNFYGRVALEAGAAPSFGRSNFAYLQRCGSRQRLKLPPGAPLISTDSLSGSRNAIVWKASNRVISGVRVPSLRRFRIRLSSTIAENGMFYTALSWRRLYVVDPGDPSGFTYSARLPPR